MYRSNGSGGETAQHGIRGRTRLAQVPVAVVEVLALHGRAGVVGGGASSCAGTFASTPSTDQGRGAVHGRAGGGGGDLALHHAAAGASAGAAAGGHHVGPGRTFRADPGQPHRRRDRVSGRKLQSDDRGRWPRPRKEIRQHQELLEERIRQRTRGTGKSHAHARSPPARPRANFWRTCRTSCARR